MITVIREETIKKARKDHSCDACVFLRENIGELDKGTLTFSELRAVARAKANGYKIKKGESYKSQFNEMDGDVYTFKYIPEISAICFKYNLYPEY